MILILSIVILSVVALALILAFAHGPRHAGDNLDQLASQLRPLDADAFHNLIDEREEEFLRTRLPGPEFRAIHRERMLAAVEYTWGAAHNAGILIRLADAARQSADPEVVAAAQMLQENASHFRLYAFQVVPRFYLSMLIPSLRATSGGFADSYHDVARQMVVLGCLQSPARVRSQA